MENKHLDGRGKEAKGNGVSTDLHKILLGQKRFNVISKKKWKINREVMHYDQLVTGVRVFRPGVEREGLTSLRHLGKHSTPPIWIPEL